MSLPAARRIGPGWLSRCLLGSLLLLSLRQVTLQPTSRYGSGLWRRGRRLVGPTPLANRRVTSAAQCLSLCGRTDTCSALQFGDLSTTVNCELFGQRACDGHKLVTDAAVSYYDVYRQPPAEASASSLQHERCVSEGYCSTSCVGEQCAADKCSSQPPPNAYHCVAGLCQLTDNFWEVGSGLVLPKWMNWTVSPMITTFKRLKPNTCALNISLKLGDGAVVFGAATTNSPKETRLLFRLHGDTTDLFYHDSTGNQHSLVQNADTTGMVQRGLFSPLRVSWCSGVMAVGPADSPPLVTGKATVSQPLLFIVVRGLRSLSWLRVEADVADPWLFDGADMETDPVFELTVPAMISRSIPPTKSVSITYDCMTDRQCGVWFCASPVEMVYVSFGVDRAALIYRKVNAPKQTFEKRAIGPMLNNSTYTKVTVHYKSGAVSVFKGSETTPIYSAMLPFAMPDITSIGIGFNGSRGTRNSVRVARYDPEWNVDTWHSQGVGFSNMALWEVPQF